MEFQLRTLDSEPKLDLNYILQREGGMNWEIGIDIYTLSCVKRIAKWEAVV